MNHHILVGHHVLQSSNPFDSLIARNLWIEKLEMQKENRKQNKGNRGRGVEEECKSREEKRREGDYGTWLVILRYKGLL